MTNILQITEDCWFKHTPNHRIILCYMEDSPNSWIDRKRTEIDLSLKKALDIIQWLSETVKYKLAELEKDVEKTHNILDALMKDTDDGLGEVTP